MGVVWSLINLRLKCTTFSCASLSWTLLLKLLIWGFILVRWWVISSGRPRLLSGGGLFKIIRVLVEIIIVLIANMMLLLMLLTLDLLVMKLLLRHQKSTQTRICLISAQVVPRRIFLTRTAPRLLMIVVNFFLSWNKGLRVSLVLLGMVIWTEDPFTPKTDIVALLLAAQSLINEWMIFNFRLRVRIPTFYTIFAVKSVRDLLLMMLLKAPLHKTFTRNGMIRNGTVRVERNSS